MSFLEVKNLCKSTERSGTVKDINFSVSKGEKIVIMSRSKKNKSMLLRLIKGLEVPDSGEILFSSGLSGTEKIGMFSQDFHLFSNMNVLENLCLAPVKLLGTGRRNAERMARDRLSAAGLITKAQAMPENLSEGQRQRIAICRTLMTEPEVMLFDDIENLVDPNVTSEVSAMIKMLAKQDLTMILSVDQIDFASEIADRVIFISDSGDSDGKILEDCKPEEFFSQPKTKEAAEFVRKLRSFNCKFDTCDFDLIALESSVQNFAVKYGLSKHQAYTLQICVEELVYEMLFGSCKFSERIDLSLEVSYSSSDSSVIIALAGKGSKFNPFEDEDEGEGKGDGVHLGVSMLKKIAKNIAYGFNDGDRMNYLTVTV